MKAVNYFVKRFIVDVWQGSEYVLDFEYDSVLNVPVFWIYQSCEYARVTQRSEYAWICLNNSWICLNLSEWLSFYIYPL